MYDVATREQMRARMRTGVSLNRLSKASGISRAALREWRDHPERDQVVVLDRAGVCPRCSGAPLQDGAYAYLLGMYLGDGCVSALTKGVYSLRITCDLKYPGIIEEASDAIRAVKSGGKVHHVGSIGCLHVSCAWKHWPCVFPQHGPGPKHKRSIQLVDWQRSIAADHPGALLRGLFHFDGCRIKNWTTRPVAGRWKRYEYPRYLFSNESEDIRTICTGALDQLGARWTQPRRNVISVARKESVALLDGYVGPKS